MAYQSRYSRGRGRTPSQGGGGGAALVVLLSCALVVFLVCTSSAGDFISEKIIAPVMSFLFPVNNNDDAIDMNNAPSNSDEPEGNEQKPVMGEGQGAKLDTLNLQLMPKSFYLLQMDYFSDSTSAALAAEQYKQLGAAGYIVEESGLYRVIAAAYADEQSLHAVQSQLRADGYGNSAYILHTAAVKVKIESIETVLELCRSGFALLQTLPDELTSMALSADMGSMSRTAVLDELTNTNQDIQLILSDISDVDSSDALGAMRSALGEYSQNLSTFIANDGTIEDRDFSAMLKYLQIQTIDSYSKFILSISEVENEES